MFALVVDECAHAAPLVARNDDLARSEGTLLYEDGRNRTAASVELGFHHRAFGRPVRIGLEIEDFGLQQDRLEQLVEVGLVLRRNLDVENLTAHGFDEDLVLQQLGADLLRIRGRLVDLVDRHDDRNAGRLGMVDRLDRLRHHAVIGRDDEDGDVRRLGAAGAHGRKGRVAGRVDEGDLLAVLLDLVGTDVLRDAACLAGNHVGVADGVEQRRLAVVDVTHDRHDRRPRLHVVVHVGDVEDAFLDVRFGNALDRVAEFAGDELREIGVDQVAGLHHLAFLHQEFDDVDRALGHALRQFLNRDGFRQDDFAGDLLARFLHLAALELLLAAAHR